MNDGMLGVGWAGTVASVCSSQECGRERARWDLKNLLRLSSIQRTSWLRSTHTLRVIARVCNRLPAFKCELKFQFCQPGLEMLVLLLLLPPLLSL